MRRTLLYLLLATACTGDLPPQSAEPTPSPQPALPSGQAPSASPVAETLPAESGEGNGALQLPPITEAEKGPERQNGRRRIGAHRALPAALPGKWLTEDGAAVWRLEVRSAEAVAIRLHFTDFQLAGGLIAVMEADAALRPAAERQYRDAGPGGDGEFWSDLLEGPAAIVEYRPPAGAEAAGPPPFRVDKISHLWQSPLDAF